MVAALLILVSCTPAATESQPTTPPAPMASVQATTPAPVVTPTATPEATPTATPAAGPPATEPIKATAPPDPQPTDTLEPSSKELPDDPTALMQVSLHGNLNEIARKMTDSGNPAFIPVLMEFMRFHSQTKPTLGSHIATLATGADAADVPVLEGDKDRWDWWVEWLGNHPDVQGPPGYAEWKGDLYSLVDRGLGSFLYDGVKSRIRLEEIAWGGVRKDGIPDLINPPTIAAEEADYLSGSDRVFGVSLNGQHRAYPLRILNPHEMANDVVGGVPFALAY